ncbi:MAG: hypothetical protein DWH78_11550 [Planctomycetota bacterium]|nr:MAG: hypothetical protein DWH78_11550 [Planctomycetota bacterium]
MSNGLLLGWKLSEAARSMGFQNPDLPRRRGRPFRENAPPATYEGDSHLMTFAPTGSGRGMIIPTLLSYPGSVVVIDLKGENYTVTARQRRKMGHQVVVLDPFEKATRGLTPTDRFNPFDIFKLPGTIVDAVDGSASDNRAAKTNATGTKHAVHS